MKVGVIGVGDMGLAITGHLIGKQHTVSVYDINSERAQAAGQRGAAVADSLAKLAKLAEVFVVIVSTDDQSRDVTTAISEHAAPGSLIAVAATNHPATMSELAKLCASRGIRFIDAPVVYGASGAKQGTLLSLCGGDEADVEFARPVLSAYSSRGVMRVGPVGAGQLAKACNNLLHWVHCVSNFEALLLAKRYGVDAQRMREVLLECPAYNGTLDRWDTTRFTWQEKDMDVTMDLAQEAGLVLPLSGQVDQLVKLFKADDVAALLYGPEASYLGVKVKPLSPAEGGLGS
jgi:3-hydroxyisobutyrate dehydrogenase